MTPPRFQTIEQIFLAAVEQQPDQVSAFLDTACDGDPVLRREVEVLLASDQRAGRFIEKSAVGLATKIIESQQADPLVGETIGHYKISESLGTGGMGEVYLATDITARRKAALKILPTRFTGDAERLKRFEQEAHAVVGLNHPNILTVYEIGEDQSTHYIASELIEGETLRQRLVRGPMELGEVVDIAIQVASALAVAHQAGIVHRDIKPENVMLRPDGYVKVLDFGIAKLAEQELPATIPTDEALSLVETNLGSILGTAHYMSPEQACGARVDERTDIWSLGVVLYEILTGHAPFSADTPKEVMSSILEKEPPPVTRYIARAPAELQQIVSKTLRKNREERYPSAHELLHALKDLRRKLEAKLERAAAPLWLRWARSSAALAFILLVAALAAGVATVFFLRVSRQKIMSVAPANIPPSVAAVTQLPEKSIAVLPFENLSKGEENAFFAGGVQDEILSDLAKIADLKVISRTSVMQYKSGPERNLREIAKAVGVSYVVEGSVQRAGERVRVSAQLIDARNDTHLWAEHYDRDVADVFAIQSEIAQQIAEQLRAKLSPAEKAAIAERPTADLAAYALYTKAKEIDIFENWEGAEKGAKQKIELLEKATQRDPNFALAYCALAKTHTFLSAGTDEHLELAKKAAEAALRVRPDLGEAHLELARYYFYAYDFDRARDELAIVRRKLPNNAEALLVAAKIDRHQNRWDSAVANLRKAVELDPRNVEAGHWLRVTYFEMRRYSDLEQLVTKDAASGDPWSQWWLAVIKLSRGDPVAAQSLLDQVPLDFSPKDVIWLTRFLAALYLRDYDAASRVVASGKVADDNRAVAEGELAHARGDNQKALAAFAAAREKLDAVWGDKPTSDNFDYLKEVSKIDAGLSRKDQAIREARRAVDLNANDPYERTSSVVNLALVYAWTGERERALEQLEIAATIPGGPDYGDLLLNPCWESLRGDKRFDKIVAAAKAASR
jgi:serine/threonine protein kinase/thioredoxin-like negative regulator of GroEL